MLATYGAKYRSLKAPRKLQWRPNLGTVQLDLAIGDQTLEFNVGGGSWGDAWGRQHLWAGRGLLVADVLILA